MHAIIVGFAQAAIAMAVCKKQVEKQWRQQVVMEEVQPKRYFDS